MPTWPLEEIRLLLAPSLAHMGYSIHSLEQAGRGGRTLRLAIDTAEGLVGIDDCEKVSHVAGPLLDQVDVIAGPYTLEVSSPGAERELRSPAEYERFTGRKVNVRFRAGDSEVVLEGTLALVDETGIGVGGRPGEVARVEWPDLISGRLMASW